MFAPALLALALSPIAPSPDLLHRRAEKLVARLGHPDYRDREKAAQELLEMGYAARDAVLAGQKSPDAEINERCKKLYPAIWRHDLEKRVQKFLATPEGAIPDDLPGAARWIKVVGDGKVSRELYAEMVRAHHEPLLQVELHPERLKDVYADFMKSVYARIYGRRPVGSPVNRPTPTDADVLVFLFLGAAGDARPTTALPGTSSTYYYQFLNSPFVLAKLSANPPVAPFRTLFTNWLEKERYSVVLRRAIDIAAQHGVKECAPTALRIAGDAATTPYVRAMALLGFGKLGTKDDIKSLEPFLKDKLQIAAVVVNGERGTVQMRDVAMGAAVKLAGESLAEFGFERKPPAGLVNVTYSYYAFGTDAKREAAHAKWAEWAKENLKK